MSDAESYDNGDMYTDLRGFCYCSAHQKELCHDCCCDHRPTNEMTRASRRGEVPDVEGVLARHDRVTQAEHDAVMQLRTTRGGQGPLELDSEEHRALFDAVAAPPPSGSAAGQQQRCLQCGATAAAAAGGQPAVTLKRCSGCTLGHAKFCGVTCQKEGWATHRQECKANASVIKKAAAAGSPTVKIVTWEALEELEGQQATDSILEVRIMSVPMPPFMRSTVEAKDRKGGVGTIAFYSTSPPAGLAQGKVLRWRNPHFHYFMSGQTGARIEDEDIPNITISDA